MRKKDIIISIIIFVIVFFIVYIILDYNKNRPLNIKFYPNPYNYTANISNNSIYINLNDIQLPYINSSELMLNVSGNIYNLSCENNIIYQNQSTICVLNNVSAENVTYIQLLYPYDNVLYNIVYNR